MRFYGNGKVRLPGDAGSLRFSTPAVKYEKGYLDVSDDSIAAKLVALGYDHDKPEPVDTEEPAELSERDILAAQAESLGIKVKGNWGVRKITAEIKKFEESLKHENS
jgi:hypothetical protein